ncbi:MAG: DUF5715 family protein [bacterium]|nr:DUF5715 family protein [bacterium]
MKGIFAVAVILVITAVQLEAQELKGSPNSIAWQYLYAESEGLKLFSNKKAVMKAVENGTLVSLEDNPDLEFFEVSFPYVLPKTKQFVDWFENARPTECGPKLVVTSGTRALNRQPKNAHPLSIHTRGVSVDLRIPEDSRCWKWFRDTLLSLENRDMIDVTLETKPWHLHVAVFSFIQDGEELVATR